MLRYAIFHAAVSFSENWGEFFFVFEAGTEKRAAVGSESERYLADWLARTCYRMEPASEQDQMQCILEDHFLPGMAISIAAIALCFLAALMKIHETSSVEPLDADGFQTSLHPSEAGPGSWVRMIRDKDLTEEPQVLLGVFTASEAEVYFFCRFSTFSRCI